MAGLTNAFAVLGLDAGDDRLDDGSPAAPTAAREKNGSSAKKNKKANGSGNGVPMKNDKPDEGSSVVPSTEYRMPLVWIDLEMTGLDVEVDRILEIACIITDGSLNKSIEGPDLVIHQSKECLDRMGEWCRDHHAASGLTKRVLDSTITEREAEMQVKEFVKKNVGSYTPHLAGNSVSTCLIWLVFFPMYSLMSVVSRLCVSDGILETSRKPLRKKTDTEQWMTSGKASRS
ncbi:oligoribonuclease isoform X2 [Syzygium oleosum]|uniref:oligoribonuclease isoform X2 n=1 Tax=Syzygium oleosum TaxID=219896 RepID=UPI0024B91934|nr:oligoribonuclease isoform X2 [Syzygium oleosum]